MIQEVGIRDVHPVLPELRVLPVLLDLPDLHGRIPEVLPDPDPELLPDRSVLHPDPMIAMMDMTRIITMIHTILSEEIPMEPDMHPVPTGVRRPVPEIAPAAIQPDGMCIPVTESADAVKRKISSA